MFDMCLVSHNDLQPWTIFESVTAVSMVVYLNLFLTELQYNRNILLGFYTTVSYDSTFLFYFCEEHRSLNWPVVRICCKL